MGRRPAPAVPGRRVAPRRPGWARVVVAAVDLAALGGAALAGCAPAPDRAPAPAGVPVASEEARGVTMTVVGQVSKVIGAHVFQLGREGAAPILVFDPAPVDRLHPGSPVEVTGTLKTFVRRALERGYHVALDRSGTAPFEGRPVLVAATLSVGR